MTGEFILLMVVAVGFGIVAAIVCGIIDVFTTPPGGRPGTLKRVFGYFTLVFFFTLVLGLITGGGY